MQGEFVNRGGKLWLTPVPEVCVDCLRRLVFITVSEASRDETLRRKAMKASEEIIEEFRNTPGITPAGIANRFHPVIKKICQNEDPFLLKKMHEMATARSLSNKYPPKDGNNIESLLIYSLIGNSIDFFREVEDLEKSILNSPNIVLSDISDLLSSFRAGRISRIILLADNAGEVYFDMPLVRFLVNGGIDVFYAVKETPVQNDLSMDDLVREGLLEMLEEMGARVISTGVSSVGLDYEKTSQEFKRIYEETDLILAKGMGHLETLGRVEDGRLFYLFEAKCPTIARTFGLSIGDFVACRGSSLMSIYNRS